MITYVVPCGAGKATLPAPARDLYTGSMFRHVFANAERCARLDEEYGRGPARVLILSAKHGLIEPDAVVAPYDLKMGGPGSVTAATIAYQAHELGIRWRDEVHTMLPRQYFKVLDDALKLLYVNAQDMFHDCRGNGEQRRIASIVGRPSTATAAVDPAGGLHVWIGVDAPGLAWGLPVLVSYGRLRRYQDVLPVAHAPWVLDSRGFNEIREHGEWTITAEQYAADVRRYQTEIGCLAWVAPQDWPAAAVMLERTGLTEHEHQLRTTRSVVQLREMLPDVPVIAVLTGATVEGYLRHIRMYAEHGIDLHTETAVVGVGALVGRQETEAAAIIRAIHGAGLTRLHGFGVKGPVLDLVGDLLTSIDSADWSRDARYTVGRCRHGNGIDWESNCPIAASEWATEQRRRASTAGRGDEQLALLFALELCSQTVTHHPAKRTRAAPDDRPAAAEQLALAFESFFTADIGGAT